MSSTLPDRPSLEHLRKQAKDLLSSYRKGDSTAKSRMAFLPGLVEGAAVALHDAQSVVAREHGIASWAKLVAEVERRLAASGITPEIVAEFLETATTDRQNRCRRLMELYPVLPAYSDLTALVCGDAERLKAALARDPSLATYPQGGNKWTPLEYASYSRFFRIELSAYAGLEECVRLLLKAGADPNSSHLWPEDNMSPLSALYGAAGETGHIGIVKQLLEAGANPNDEESMYHAAQHNSREILELLLQHGGDVDAKGSKWTNTPVFFLCGWRPTDSGYDDVLLGIEWLLQHGADPNAVSYPQKSAETALHCACRTAGTRLVDMLLVHGADPSIKRADGKTAYELAIITGNLYAVQAIRKAGGAIDLPAGEAALADALEGRPNEVAAEWLHAHPEDAKFSLIKMAELGNAAGVRALLALGVDPAVRNDEAQTPLHYACFCGQTEAAAALLERGAPVDAVENQYEGTPVGWALHGFQWNHREGADYAGLFRLLLEAGAKREDIQGFIDRTEEEIPEQVAILREVLEG